MSRLLDTSAKGVFPISVTPFLDDGAIDLASMDRLLDYFVGIGVPGITVLGFMGEANRLSEIEAQGLVKHVTRRVGAKLKVIVGISQTGLDSISAFSHFAIDAGAAGVMISPPQGLRNDEQINVYFDTLISRLGAGVPIVLQDYPQNSGVFLSADVLGGLFARHPSLVVLKHEEGSALRKITRVRAQEKGGARPRISILVGNSGIYLPQEMRRGVDGANTGVAFAEIFIEICNRFFDGKGDAGEDLYDVLLPLIRHEHQPGIGLAIRKEIFRRRGLITSARARAPGPSLDAVDHEELTGLLQRLERRLKDTGEDKVIASYAPWDKPVAVPKPKRAAR